MNNEILVIPEDVDPTLPEYEPPQVVTYRGQQILEALGPAQACISRELGIPGCSVVGVY